MRRDVIEVYDCWFKYRNSKTWALKGISLRIKEGSFSLVVGPTGSGKSTLLRLFNGLIPHFYEGEFKGLVKVMGLDTRKHSVAELSKYVGMVFQDPENQIVTLTVENEVAFGLENLGLPRDLIRERVNKVLRDLNLEGLRHYIPFELSSGQQQRVIIASILAMEPEIIVLDEPTSNMDLKTAWNFIRLLKKIHDEFNKTIILVEHRLDYVIPFVDQVIVMYDGVVVKCADPYTVIEEGILGNVGVDEPKIPLLFRLLKKEQLYSGGIPLSIDEAVETLKKILRR